MFLSRNFKLVLITVLIVIVSQLSRAQVVQNNIGIVPQIEQIDSVVQELGRDIKPSLPEQDISKRLVDNADFLSTSPLNSLPDVLTIPIKLNTLQNHNLTILEKL